MVDSGLEQAVGQQVATLGRGARGLWRCCVRLVQVTRSGRAVVHGLVAVAGARARRGRSHDKGMHATIAGSIIIGIIANIWQRVLLLLGLLIPTTTRGRRRLARQLLLGIEVVDLLVVDLLLLLVLVLVVERSACQVGLVQRIGRESMVTRGGQVVVEIGSGQVVLVQLLLLLLELLLQLLLLLLLVVSGRHYKTTTIGGG